MKTWAILAGLFFTAATMSEAGQGGDIRAESQQRESRYQIGVMERVLEGAVEHGATIMRDRLQTLLPAPLLLSDNARARGFRLDGYGLFFDVEVPSLERTLPWSFLTLNQNDLGLENALKALKEHIQAAGDADLQQALQRIELQVGPRLASSRVAATGARVAAGTPSTVSAATVGSQDGADSILNDPQEAYRTEVKRALVDAMLDHSGPLGIAPTEWLTIAARRNDDRPRLAPVDTDARTVVIRLSGADLAAFRTGQVSRDDVINRIEVRVF